jgi:hypothetical protein
MSWFNEDRTARPDLNPRLFANTQHPATHNPKWRDLGDRGRKGGTRKWRHRVCRLCGLVEYKTTWGNWVQERGDCRHRG